MKNHYHTKNSYENFSPLTIKSVEENSIAEELGLEPYDRIIRINNQNILDELDYYYFTSLENFTLEILKNDGSLWEFEVELDEDEKMGLTFFSTLDSKVCSNHCVFCFIDQLPEGLRDSLYIKDDDERLSFLNGNYVTLTNLSEAEIERICTWKIPINISVHSTDEKLRTKMLANTRASEINTLLDRFAKAFVPMNAQIVLVPELNDKTLIQTIRDLYSYYPYMQSVSVVPVGLTKFRSGLYPIRLYNRSEAREIIDEVKLLQREFESESETPFVFLSDEFYLLAEYPIPDSKHYGPFSQLENGVGMIRNFTDSFKKALEDSTGKLRKERFLLLTGELFFPILNQILITLKKLYPALNADIIKITNEFFGKSIGVAGLLTGTDILNQLENVDLNKYDVLLLPDTMLKNETDFLLDDINIKKLNKKLGIKIQIVPNDGKELLKTFFE